MTLKLKWGISYFVVPVLWPECFERWNGAALRDTEKCSDTFSCCRVVSCSANEADIKNTLKEGTERMLSPLFALPPWWKLHVNARSSLTLVARLRDRGTKVVYRDTCHANFLELCTALLPCHRSCKYSFKKKKIIANLEMQTINVHNCTRVSMRSIAGPFKPLRVDPEWQERVLSMFSFGFRLFSNVFSPMQKIKDD